MKTTITLLLFTYLFCTDYSPCEDKDWGQRFDGVAFDTLTKAEFEVILQNLNNADVLPLLLARKLMAFERKDLLLVMFRDLPGNYGEVAVGGVLWENKGKEFAEQVLTVIMREEWSLDGPLLRSGALPSVSLAEYGIGTANRLLPGVVGKEGTDEALEWFTTRKSRIRLADALDKVLAGAAVETDLAQLSAAGPLLPGEIPGAYGQLRYKMVATPDPKEVVESVNGEEGDSAADSPGSDIAMPPDEEVNSVQSSSSRSWLFPAGAICLLIAGLLAWAKCCRPQQQQ